MLAIAILMYALAPAAMGQVEPSAATAAAAQTQTQAPTQTQTQTQAQTSPAAEAPAAPRTLKVAAGTQVEVELVDPLSSTTSKLGDRFAIRLAQPISSQGVDLIAPGATGQGEVIDVARAGMGGRQGKLIISARYLDLNGKQVRIRGMTLLASGKSRVDLATGVLLVPYAGVAAVFIQGGEIQIPAGARATVRLAEDLDLPVSATPPSPTTEQTGTF
jgi:hypothetical protein